MRILLADDQTLFRESLGLVLKMTFPTSKISNANSWQGVFARVEHDFFDLLLVDLMMPEHDQEHGWNLCLERLIAGDYGAVCVISGLNNRAYIRQAYNLGIRGYICKTASLEQMQAALLTISAGHSYLPDHLFRQPSEQHVHAETTTTKVTWRQQEILELMRVGHSNKAIAAKLLLKEGTVKRHVYNLYRNLGAKNRTDALRIGQQQGLLT